MPAPNDNDPGFWSAGSIAFALALGLALCTLLLGTAILAGMTWHEVLRSLGGTIGWPPPSPVDLRDRLEQWLLEHDLAIDLVTVWSISVGAAILGLVDLITWAVLRGSRDQTQVGRALKTKKLSTGDAWWAIAVLYSATLFAYYLDAQFNLWERLAVRLFLILGIWIAVVFGLIFLIAYRNEGWGKRPPDQE